MEISDISNNLCKERWGENNFRQLKHELLMKVQTMINGFSPINMGDFKNNPIQLIDFFCGAGGLGLGLQKAGFKILLSFDIDSKCIESFPKEFSFKKFSASI